MSALDKVVSPLGLLLRGKRAGEKHSVRRAPELATDRTIEFSSPAFRHTAGIPDRHAYKGRGPNISPALDWGPLPEGTRQLLLVMEDIDVPIGRPALHLVALVAPELGGFAEGALSTENPDARYVPGAMGHTGYAGPRALPGHGVHRYGFHLYALDIAVPEATPLPGLAELLPLVRGHVLAAGFFEGTQKG